MTTDDLTWMPAWRIRELILARDVSCVEVTEHFLGRIEELNKAVRAMEDVDADGARRQAANADRRLAAGGEQEAGPLLGIPVAVKANMRVEGLPHTILRSGRPPGSASRFDDIIVERLRAADAVVVGTNTMMGTGGGGVPDPERPGVFRPPGKVAMCRFAGRLATLPSSLGSTQPAHDTGPVQGHAGAIVPSSHLRASATVVD